MIYKLLQMKRNDYDDYSFVTCLEFSSREFIRKRIIAEEGVNREPYTNMEYLYEMLEPTDFHITIY